MKEIEVKAHLKDREKVVKELEELGAIFSAPIKQIDTVYTRIIGNIEEYLKNDHFVRIREKSDGRYIFTVKKPKAIKENLVKTEYETEVKDAKELKQALFLMGYQLSNKVTKVRYAAKFKDYEICLDDVEELGSFIELEKMVDDSVDDVPVLEELKSFLFSLSVESTDEVQKGYDVMMVEKLFDRK